MKIINLEQGSQAWLDKRRQCITATDSSAINGSNPWSNARDIWQMKLGMKPPPEMNDKMRLGQVLEPEARAWLNNDTGLNFVPIVALHDTYSWAMASLDGYDADNDIICEIKCPSNNKLFDLAEQGVSPAYYYCQMQKQLYVTGCKMCIFFIYRRIKELGKEEDTIITKSLKIFPNYDFIKDIFNKELDFYENYLCAFREPEESSFKLKLKSTA